MPFYIAAALILLYAGFVNLKKGFLLFFGFNLFLNTNITLLSVPGIPILALEDVMILFFLLLSLLKGRKYSPRLSFPWTKPCIFLFFSYLITAIFAAAGFGAEITGVIKNLLEKIIMLLLLWKFVEEEKDFKRAYRLLTVIFFISCVYALVEYALQMNPLTLYEQTLNHDPSKMANNIYRISSARGYRVNSIFFHAIGAGCNWAMYVILTLYLFVRGEDKTLVNVFSLLTAGLSLLCVFLTKQRSPLIFLFVGVLSSLEFKKKRTYLLMVFAMLALLLIWPFIESYINIVLSIFDPSVNVGGSSLNMRIGQFRAGYALMKEAPLFGLGSKFERVISNTYTEQILGMESIWLEAGLKYGILGLLCQLYFFFFQAITVPFFFKSRPMVWVVFAYWMTATVTSTPGLNTALYFFILSYMAKSSKKYRSYDEGISLKEWNIQPFKSVYKYRKIYRLF